MRRLNPAIQHEANVDRSLQRRIDEGLLDDIALKIARLREGEPTPLLRDRCAVLGSELLRMVDGEWTE